MDTEDNIRQLHSAGDLQGALTVALDTYGSEVFGFLVGSLSDNELALDAFSDFTERLWSSLPAFEWRCSFRTWMYVIARRAGAHAYKRRAQEIRRRIAVSQVPEVKLAIRRATSAPVYRRTSVRDELSRLRAQLSPEDRELLTLRIDRDLSWRDIAMILIADPPGSDEQLARLAAQLRKRFERLKSRLRQSFVAHKQGETG